jgi:hypothetical protein
MPNKKSKPVDRAACIAPARAYTRGARRKAFSACWKVGECIGDGLIGPRDFSIWISGGAIVDSGTPRDMLHAWAILGR